jgi:hypothetical protein
MADFQADGHFGSVNYGTRPRREQTHGQAPRRHDAGYAPEAQSPYGAGHYDTASYDDGHHDGGQYEEAQYDEAQYEGDPYDGGQYGNGGDQRDSASVGALFTWVGGVVSLALVAGIGLWGYQMVMRDVSGVPVVRAMTGETRRIPTDAGGQTADFLGLSVNHVAAAKEAASAPDQVTLAPNAISLGDDALTEEELAARSAIPVSAPAPLDIGEADGTGENAAAIARLRADGEGTSQGLGEDMAGSATLRPKARPASLSALASVVQASASAADVPQSAPPAETVTNIAADAVPAGTQLAQLGAFASEEIALSEWTRLSKDFDIYLAGKSRVIQKAETGGRTFYRLRAMGFTDLSDTRRFCAALVADKADCIPVLTK